MQLTPTVISAQPLEKAIRGYLDRHDHAGLEHFLSTQRAPDIADIVDRLADAERDEVFSMLPGRVKAVVLSEVGVETKRSLLEDLPRQQKRERNLPTTVGRQSVRGSRPVLFEWQSHVAAP